MKTTKQLALKRLRRAGIVIFVLEIGFLYGAKPVAAMPAANPSLSTEMIYNNQKQSEAGKPPRIVSDPLRIEGEPFVNKRLFMTLFLLLAGLASGAWSGKYFCDRHYIHGALLMSFGWFCGFGAWSIGFLRWFL